MGLLFDDWHHWLSLQKEARNICGLISGSDCLLICSSPSYPLMQMSKCIVSQLEWLFILWFPWKTCYLSLSKTWENHEKAVVKVWFYALIWIPESPLYFRALWVPSVQAQYSLQHLPLRNTLIRSSIHYSCWIPTLFQTFYWLLGLEADSTRETSMHSLPMETHRETIHCTRSILQWAYEVIVPWYLYWKGTQDDSSCSCLSENWWIMFIG